MASQENLKGNNESTGTGMGLLISDSRGNWYAVPPEAIEGFRLNEEQRSAVEEALGDDVSGFSFGALSMQSGQSDQALGAAASSDAVVSGKFIDWELMDGSYSSS